MSIRFYCRKMKYSSFFQKWYSESCQNFFRFYWFWEVQWCSSRLKNFLDHHSVSITPSKLLHGTIALQQSDFECLKRFNLLMWMYKVRKCNFYVSSSVSNDLKTCSYVEFCSIFWLQALLKHFQWVKTIHTAYLKGPPGSGLYIGNKIMVIQLTNPFLFMKTFISPSLNAGFGNRFFTYNYVKNHREISLVKL